VSVANFAPASGGKIFSYGIPQDTAAQTGLGSPDVAQATFTVAGTNFNFPFPPYSATVISLAPAPAKLIALPLAPAASQFVLQLQGQGNVAYVIQRSTNLLAWAAISTNTLTTSSQNFTNALSPTTPRQFFRAVWQP
jgi:hypothetical protein